MDRLEVSAAEARERATLAQDQYEDVQELSGGGDEDRASWPPPTGKPPQPRPNMPNGSRFSAPPNARAPVTWPPGGRGPRR